ncbi:MAG: carboxypeptidase M32 [Pseudomonadota bacterium]
MTAFEELMAFQRETSALSQVAGRLGWDQETMMPSGAAAQRSEEMAALEAVLHARRSDERVGDWLETATTEDPVGQANLREIRRTYERATKLPAKLSAELARETSLAQGVWAQARADEDFDQFAPSLSRILALKQEQGAALADGQGSAYDALLVDYEPGTTAETIGAMFAELRAGLVVLREKVLGADVAAPELQGAFDEDMQMRVAERMAVAFGYDLDRGRIDRAVHPFSSGSGTDVRITTRTDARDPFNCLFSTIHEVGHATYEQGIDPQHALTKLGRGVSMGVHESQSRIYENQFARSRAFCGWLYGEMQQAFGALGVADADSFYAAVNRVAPGYIRTEADEVHYNLHIMMRFDLEQALVSGDLAVGDLPGAWNDRFAADFGVVVDKPSNGVLQDIHWSVGLFGYFPTYTLGNVYAGCLHQALRADLPDLDAELAAGQTGSATAWLRERVQRHGGLYEPIDLITRATGDAPSVQPLLQYLDQKFSALYRL